MNTNSVKRRDRRVGQPTDTDTDNRPSIHHRRHNRDPVVAWQRRPGAPTVVKFSVRGGRTSTRQMRVPGNIEQSPTAVSPTL
mgnify:CR=1 FL=1